MKKILTFIGIITILVFQGCGRKAVESWTYQSPNWTSDNKICFLEHHIIQRWEQTISGWTQSGGTEEINLYEINNDGSGLREVAEIESCEFEYGPELGGVSTSSAGNWVVLSMEDWRRGEHYPVIYAVKRNGDSLKEIGSGTYPDFSPDASKIVYEKPNQGIWIMNRDGTGNYQTAEDENAQQPAWSKSNLISYFSSIGLMISDTTGDILYSFSRDTLGDTIIAITGGTGMDWGSLDSLIIPGSKWKLGEWNNMEHGFLIISFNYDSIAGLVFKHIEASSFRWSSDGKHLIFRDSIGSCVTSFENNYNINLNTKWYLKDRIGGEK